MRAVGVIENTGPNNVRDTLKALLGGMSGTEVDVQVAFVTVAGLKPLLPRLRRAARRGHVRFLTGLYQHVTEPAALRLLLRTCNEIGDARFQVRLSRETAFHRKLYALRGRENLSLLVGSSNLTSSGLTSPGEFNVLVTTPKRSSAAERTLSIIRHGWEDAAPLTDSIVARYARKRVTPRRESLSQKALDAILGPRRRTRAQNATREARRDRRLWRDWVDGYVAERTAAVLAEETDWDARGYTSYSLNVPANYSHGDLLLLFDKSSGTHRARLVVIKGITQTATRTPDGRWFAAHLGLRNSGTRKVNRKFLRSLAELGIRVRQGGFDARRRLAAAVEPGLRRLFRKRRR